MARAKKCDRCGKFHEHIENEMMKYEPYWKPCIILYVDN